MKEQVICRKKCHPVNTLLAMAAEHTEQVHKKLVALVACRQVQNEPHNALDCAILAEVCMRRDCDYKSVLEVNA